MSQRILQIMPSAMDWRVVYVMQDGTTWSQPLVGWALIEEWHCSRQYCEGYGGDCGGDHSDFDTRVIPLRLEDWPPSVTTYDTLDNEYVVGLDTTNAQVAESHHRDAERRRVQAEAHRRAKEQP